MVLLKLRSKCSWRSRWLPHHGRPWRGRASREIPTKRMLIGLLLVLLLKLLRIAVHVVDAETNANEAKERKENPMSRKKEETEKKCREDEWLKPLNPKHFVSQLLQSDRFQMVCPGFEFSASRMAGDVQICFSGFFFLFLLLFFFFRTSFIFNCSFSLIHF